MKICADNQHRIAHSAAWILEWQSTQHVVTRLVNTEGVHRRTARRICRAAWDQFHADVQEVPVENLLMAGKLVHMLESTAVEGLHTGKVGAMVSSIRELNAMLGIGKNHHRPVGWNSFRRT